MTSSLFWGFGWKVASELGFDFLDGGQTASQGILGDEPVLLPAVQQADGGLVVGMAQEVVHGGEVVIERWCGVQESSSPVLCSVIWRVNSSSRRSSSRSGR